MRLHTLGVGLGVLLAASCGGSAPTRAGGESPPITLTAVATAPVGFPAGDQLAHFADAVAQLSDGAVRIDVIETSWGEAETVAAVQNGDADLGFAPSRVFDTLGVTSLRALSAPMLIDSNELADIVLADQLADDMLDGLGDIGLRGLGVAFDSLIQPMGYPEPLLEPADFAGAVIQSLPRATQEAVLNALGAEATHAVNTEMNVGMNNGEIDGRLATVEVPLGGGHFGPITGNVVLGLKAITVFTGSPTFDGLTADQQDVLRQAATDTRDWAATQHLSLAAGANKYCAERHADVVLATDAQVAALRDAVEPVYAELEADPFTRDAIERIEALAADVGETPAISACTGAAPDTSTAPTDSDASTAPADDQHAIDGMWRITVDLDPNSPDWPDPARTAALNSGVWTVQFNNGHRYVVDPTGTTVNGTYVIHGDRLTLQDDDLPDPYEMIWHRDGDVLVLLPGPDWDPVYVALDTAIFGPGLTRIGDATITPGNQ